MRNSFQSLKWILVFVIVVFVALTFFDWGGAGEQGNVQAQGFAAKVNGETISLRDYNRALYNAQQQYAEMYQQELTPEMIQTLGLPKQVIDGLVDQKLILQQADNLELAATPEEIRKKILTFPVFSPNGKFVGEELYVRYVTSSLNYPSAAAFEEDVARDLTIAKMESAMMNSVVITPQGAEQEFRRRTESAKLRYLLLPADKMLPSVAITPAEIDTYYKQNGAKYSHPEQRNVKYLLADVGRIRSQMKVDDAQVRAEYDRTRESYKSGEAARASHILIKTEASATPQEVEAARARAAGLAARARAGEDFAALAKANSADPGSAVNGGDLNFFERGQMVAEFEQTAFSQPVGSISDPIKTQYGFHVIKVTGKRGGGYKTFEEVRPQITTSLLDTRSKAQAREELTRVQARIQQNKPKSEADLKQYEGGVITLNDSLWFGKTEAVEGFGRLPQLNEWAYRAKVGDVGEIIETDRGMLIPYLVATRPSGISPMAEIKARVENDAKMARARELAKQQLTVAMKDSSNLDVAAAKIGATPVEASVTREGFITGLSGNVKQLVDAAMAAKAGAAITAPVVVDQGAVVFQVIEKKPFDPKVFGQQRQFIVNQLRQRQLGTIRASLLARLRKEASVEVNNEILAPAATTPAPARS